MSNHTPHHRNLHGTPRHPAVRNRILRSGVVSDPPVFRATNPAIFITRQSLAVNGGLTIQLPASIATGLTGLEICLPVSG